MPVSCDRAAFKRSWSRNFDLDQDHRDQHDREGHKRVHDDTQRAVVSIASGRMGMHYLGHGQKRE